MWTEQSQSQVRTSRPVNYYKNNKGKDMRTVFQLKYLSLIPPIASICLCYLAWRLCKLKLLLLMHTTLESHKILPEAVITLQESVERNSNLMLMAAVVVMSSWFAFAPDSIPNIYTHMIGTWIYTALDLLINLRVHPF